MSSTCVVNLESENDDLLLLEKEEEDENNRMNTTTTTATSMSMTSATKNDGDEDDKQQEIDCDQQQNIEFVGFDDGEYLIFDDTDLGFDDKVSTDGNTGEAENEKKKDKVKPVSVFLSNTSTTTSTTANKDSKEQQQQRASPWFTGTTSHWKEIVTEKYRYSNPEKTQTKEEEEGQEEKEQKEQTKGENDDENNNKNNSNENQKTPTSAFAEFYEFVKISRNDSLSEKDRKLTPTPSTFTSWSQWLATKQPGEENNQSSYCETRRPIVVLDGDYEEYSRFQIIMQHHIPICYHTSNDEHKHDDGDGGNSTNASSSCVEKGLLHQALARQRKHYGFSSRQIRMYVDRMFKIDKILTTCKRGDCANSQQYRVCWAILPTQQQHQEFRELRSASYFVSDYNNYDHYHLEQKVEQQQQHERNDFVSPGGNDPQHHDDSRRRSRSIIIEKDIELTQPTSEKEKTVVPNRASHCISFPPPFLVQNSMIACRLNVDPRLFVAHPPPMIITQEMKNSKIFFSI